MEEKNFNQLFSITGQNNDCITPITPIRIGTITLMGGQLNNTYSKHLEVDLLDCTECKFIGTTITYVHPLTNEEFDIFTIEEIRG